MSNLIERQDGNHVRKINTLNLDFPQGILRKPNKYFDFLSFLVHNLCVLHSQQNTLMVSIHYNLTLVDSFFFKTQLILLMPLVFNMFKHNQI